MLINVSITGQDSGEDDGDAWRHLGPEKEFIATKVGSPAPGVAQASPSVVSPSKDLGK